MSMPAKEPVTLEMALLKDGRSKEEKKEDQQSDGTSPELTEEEPDAEKDEADAEKGEAPNRRASATDGASSRVRASVVKLATQMAKPKIKRSVMIFCVGGGFVSCILVALLIWSYISHKAVEAELREPPVSTGDHALVESSEPYFHQNRDAQNQRQGAEAPEKTGPVRQFVIDNSILKIQNCRGVAYRYTKRRTDMVPEANVSVAKWGDIVQGVDQGDGWLKVGQLYLPMTHDGVAVISLVDEDGIINGTSMRQQEQQQKGREAGGVVPLRVALVTVNLGGKELPNTWRNVWDGQITAGHQEADIKIYAYQELSTYETKNVYQRRAIFAKFYDNKPMSSQWDCYHHFKKTALHVVVPSESNWNFVHKEYETDTCKTAKYGCVIDNNRFKHGCGKEVIFMVFDATHRLSGASFRLCVMNTRMPGSRTAQTRSKMLNAAMDEVVKAGCHAHFFLGDFNSKPHCQAPTDEALEGKSWKKLCPKDTTKDACKLDELDLMLTKEKFACYERGKIYNAWASVSGPSLARRSDTATGLIDVDIARKAKGGPGSSCAENYQYCAEGLQCIDDFCKAMIEKDGACKITNDKGELQNPGCKGELQCIDGTCQADEVHGRILMWSRKSLKMKEKFYERLAQIPEKYGFASGRAVAVAAFVEVLASPSETPATE